MRAFASFLGLDSSALSRVLNAKQELSVKSAAHVVRKLKLSDADQERFIVSVARTRYVRILADLQDGTEASNINAALRASEERFRLLFEHVDQIVMLCELVRDDEGRVIDHVVLRANPAWEREVRALANWNLGRPASEWMPNLDRQWLGLYERVVRTGRPERQDIRSIDLNAWFEIFAEPTEDDRFMVLGRNVTERKRQEELLRTSERRLRTITNLVPDLLWITEADGRTIWCNRRWIEYTGLSETEAVDFGWSKLIHDDDRAHADRAYADAISAERAVALKHRLRAADGSYRLFLIRAEPVFDHDTQSWQMYGSATDIHDLPRDDEL